MPGLDSVALFVPKAHVKSHTQNAIQKTHSECYPIDEAVLKQSGRLQYGHPEPLQTPKIASISEARAVTRSASSQQVDGAVPDDDDSALTLNLLAIFFFLQSSCNCQKGGYCGAGASR